MQQAPMRPLPELVAALELELDLPQRAQHVGWANNDTLRLVSILLPAASCAPHGDSPREEESDGLDGGDPAASAARRGAARVGASLELPSYVHYLGTPSEERNAVHALGLTLCLLPTLALRLSIPTLAADFYDPVLFAVSMAVAPAASVAVAGLRVSSGVVWGITALAAIAGVSVACVKVCRRPAVRVPACI